MTPAGDPIWITLYAKALALLPRRFRSTYGAGMEAMLRDEWRERRGMQRAMLLVRAGVDLAWTAIATRLGVGTDPRDGRAAMRWADTGMDLRASMRSLARAPVFAATSVLSLALGIGGVATVYAVADRLLLRPLPGVGDPGGLVEIGPGSIPYPVVQDLAEGMTTLEGVAGHRMRTVALEPGGGADARPVQAGIVTGGYFGLLRVSPARGRLLTPDDNVEGAPPVAVLSHALWTEMGAGDDVLGTELRVNGVPLRVVGVAPADFGGLQLWSHPAFWMTVEAWPAVSLGRTPDVHSRNWGWIAAVGRVRPDVGVAAVAEEVRTVGASIAAIHRENDDAGDLVVVPSRTRATGGVGDVLRPLLLALAGVVALALLAAAANVANLVLARATRRGHELGVRAALGADRFRLGRLLAVESTILVVLGAVCGFVMSAAALRALAALRLPGGITIEAAGLHPDVRLLALGGAILVVVTVSAGLAPALLAARTGPRGLAADRSAGSSRASLRLRATFASLQIAVGVVLLAGTALFGRSIVRALSVELGFDAAHMGVVRLDASLFGDDRAAAGAAMDRFVDVVGAQAGVDAASWCTVAPLTRDVERETFDIVGRAWTDARPSVEVNAVGAGFFEAAGIPLVQGVEGVADGPVGAPVVVVNETMARRYWPGDDPVGDRIVLMGQEVDVVAVAADTRFHGFQSEPVPLAFGILPAVPSMSVNVVFRGAGAEAATRSARDLARTVDRRLVVVEVASGPALVDALLAPQRMGGGVFLLFSVLAVALSLTGVYGVVAYGVGARAREFGVRLTLGAAPGRVTREVLRANLAPAIAGIVVGGLASLALTRVAAAFLFGVTAGDALPALVAAVAVLGMAFVATWIPARRAGRVDPVAVLTAE